MMLIKPEMLTSSQEILCLADWSSLWMSQQTRNHLYQDNYSIKCTRATIQWKSFSRLAGFCIKFLFWQMFVCGLPLYTCQSRASRAVDISDLLGTLSPTLVRASMLWSGGKHRLSCRNHKICRLKGFFCVMKYLLCFLPFQVWKK